MKSIEKHTTEYTQALNIMDEVRTAFRTQAPAMHCIRTFSEARSNGRRLKFWGIQNSHIKAGLLEKHTLKVAANRVVDEMAKGLQMAGWKLECESFDGNYYGLHNVAFHLTKITK